MTLLSSSYHLDDVEALIIIKKKLIHCSIDSSHGLLGDGDVRVLTDTKVQSNLPVQ